MCGGWGICCECYCENTWGSHGSTPRMAAGNMKQLLDEVFVISGIIKLAVSDIS